VLVDTLFGLSAGRRVDVRAVWMAEPVRARRLSDREGSAVAADHSKRYWLGDSAASGDGGLASAGGNTVAAIARLVQADEDRSARSSHRFNSGPRHAQSGGLAAVQRPARQRARPGRAFQALASGGGKTVTPLL